jgi:Tol biopolymer transport system component/C-terminal processing protease CtpA/Prc
MKNLFYQIFTAMLFFISGNIVAADNPLWMRYPAISPDGKTIVFSYKGDLFTVSADGGFAAPLTIHEAYDFAPVWSPDGKFIAFASARHGNFDIFLIPAQGGKAKRLTDFSGNEIPSGFTADGKNVLYSASIQDIPTNVMYPTGLLSELYKVPAEGGRPSQILSTPAEAARESNDGNFIIFQDIKGYENSWRKHHTSAVTRDIWLYEKSANSFKKLSGFEGEDRNPVLSNDEKDIFFLSEKSGSFNVWRLSLNNPSAQSKVTAFEKNPVRFLSVGANDRLCFGYDGEIYIQDKNASPKKVDIKIAMDEKINAVTFEQKTSGATEMAVSKDGKEIAFILRGEVFVTSVDFATTKRITETPEQERSVTFSPDGRKLLYAAERDGSWNIYETSIVREQEKGFARSTLLKETPVVSTEKEEFQPLFSPDGKEVAYLESREILKVINLETKATRTILDGKYNYSYSDGDEWFQWSPDGKYFLSTFSPNSMFINDVALIAADGKSEPQNLTMSGYNDGGPKWMMEGEMMIWFSDREGLRSHGSWGSQGDIYGMFFTKEAWDKFNLSEEEKKLFDEAKEEQKKKEAEEKKKADEAKKDKNKDDDEAKKDTIKPVKIDFAGLEDRKTRLTINSSDLSDAILTPDGKKLYYLSKFEKGFDLWMKDLIKNETKLLVKLDGGGGDLQMDKEGKYLFMVSGESFIKIAVADNKKDVISYNAKFDLNLPGERDYMFEHVWRQVREKFYDPNLQGVEWDYYKNQYQKFLPYINNNFDFAEMLSEMLGELNASHTGSGHRFSDPKGDNTAQLGAFYDWNYQGDGLKILEVIEKGPLTTATSKITAGVIIEKIDGTTIKAGESYFGLLNHKTDKPTLLSLYNPQSGERWDETVKPISGGANSELLYKRWVKSRREATEKLSNGKIGYVHVRGMNSQSFREVYSEILGRNYAKEAIIVDTRFNGGGWLHDDLATLLSGKRYVDFYPRGKFFGSEPMNKWIKPSAVLISESNYSDAHGFPFAYRALDVGKTIGMPVPGTMTAVWWETLQDPTVYFGIPQVGTKDMDGNYLENFQFEPDIKQNNDYDKVVNGSDQQLEKAVEYLLNEVNQKK